MFTELGVFADLRSWSTRRWLIATGVAAFAFIALATGFAPLIGGSVGSLWWTILATALGAGLIGLIVSSYVGTPIGADATLCDTRWPALGLLALYLATEVRSLDPLVTGAARPVLAAAALALLVWALRERLSSEGRATTPSDPSGSPDGEVCTTCTPLFSRARTRTRTRSRTRRTSADHLPPSSASHPNQDTPS